MSFIPHHINATAADFTGNKGIGRYIFLPGSDGRAKAISHHFEQLQVKTHPRGHHLYLGILQSPQGPVDVASISTGMGCASMEIILHELFHLGAKRFLRVGTAGSLQPIIKIGDLINVQAAVRDEKTSQDYMPLEVPAIASHAFNLSILSAAKNLGMENNMHTGMVHCKSSLYAREFGHGLRGNQNSAYINLLSQFGVLASEMETSTLFIQSHYYNYQQSLEGNGPRFQVLAGAILGILALPPHEFANETESKVMADRLIQVAIETVKILASS